MSLFTQSTNWKIVPKRKKRNEYNAAAGLLKTRAAARLKQTDYERKYRVRQAWPSYFGLAARETNEPQYIYRIVYTY